MSKTNTPSTPMHELPEPALDEVAQFFQALAEPVRLRLLNLLRGGELKVGELAEAAQMTAANVSRHMSLLQQRGLVQRDSRGTSVYYRIADDSIYQLCDFVCGAVARRDAQRIAQRQF